MRREDEEGQVGSLGIGLNVAGKSYAATLPGTQIPIYVIRGERVAVTICRFEWQGPARTVYFCWGLKGGKDFNNGQALEGGPNKFAYAAVSVPNSPGVWTWVNQAAVENINAVLDIDTSIRENVNYDTFYWIAKTPTANESEIYVITVGGTNPIHVTSFEGVKSLDCNYVKV